MVNWWDAAGDCGYGKTTLLQMRMIRVHEWTKLCLTVMLPYFQHRFSKESQIICPGFKNVTYSNTQPLWSVALVDPLFRHDTNWFVQFEPVWASLTSFLSRSMSIKSFVLNIHSLPVPKSLNRLVDIPSWTPMISSQNISLWTRFFFRNTRRGIELKK